MKTSRLFPSLCGLLLGALALAAPGCGTEDDWSLDPSLESRTGAIQGGVLETGYPMVGALHAFRPGEPEGHICTGTLISQSWVVTAAHCAGDNMLFKTGNTWNQLQNHTVDQQIRHPILDQMLVHLASPIEGVPILKVNEGALPAIGTVCTGVGFGLHTAPNGEVFNGVKYSGTMRVEFADASEITVKEVSGLSDGGDSGGPLICGSTVAATVKGHPEFDQPWPDRDTAIYRPVDAAWIASVVTPTYSELQLQNGWTNAPFTTRNASVAMVANTVHFKGAIATAGANAVAFTLPAEFRPDKDVYVPADLCSSKKGRLFIKASNGVVTVQSEGPFSDAQCLTSLDGISFAPKQAGYFPLSLSGWSNGPSNTSSAGVQNIGGIVRFRGAIFTAGTSNAAFTLGPDYRPTSRVYVPVVLCNSRKGRLVIETSGLTTVEAEGAFVDAACMTSLDGASFAKDGTGFSTLLLQNSWTTTTFGTAAPAIKIINGVVRLRGAMKTSSNLVTASTLAFAYRPSANVNIPIDVCGSRKGRLLIKPDGTLSVQTEGAWSNAQCFVSLDGASYTLSDFTPISLENGWKNSVLNVSRPAAGVIGGIVHFKGTMANGTLPTAFQLPKPLRPPVTMYLPVNLCDGQKGRLQIGTDGLAGVAVDNGPLSQATCATSLDGVSYALSTATGWTQLTLAPGWNHAASGTRNAAVKDVNGIIRLAGAINTSGTNTLAFTLPAAFRPSANVWVTVDLCNGAKGRLSITPAGVTNVQANGNWSNAQCFTSLEGVSFAKAAGGAFFPLTLQNQWTNTSFSTRSPAVMHEQGIIRLQGAIAGGLDAVAFNLPVAFRPPTTMYVTADLCGAVKGRLRIATNGDVRVQVGEGSFSSAQCFTSLEGAWFALTQPSLP